MTKLLKLLKNFLNHSLIDIKILFNYVYLLYYKYHKVNVNCRGSYIDSPDWIKNKKAIINLNNKKYNKCLQYAVTVALNHEEIGKNSERITKTKPFTYKYNWERINFPSEKRDWKKLEKNNVTIALTVLYTEKEKISPAYISKHNSNHEKSYSFNDSKRRRTALSCSEKTNQRY